MGSENYPTEDAFSEFISENGGECNALTEHERTIYTFSIRYSGLYKALEMFASNFCEPLLLKDAAEREINAIESEFKMVVSDEQVRIL